MIDMLVGISMFWLGVFIGIGLYKKHKRDNIIPCDCGYVRYMEYQKENKK